MIMSKLKFIKVNPGNYPSEKQLYEKILTFNNATINITENNIDVIQSLNVIFSSIINKTEEDFLSKTYKGSFSDGNSFRLVTPSGLIRNNILSRGNNDIITFASMKKDGFAVHFEIV